MTQHCSSALKREDDEEKQGISGILPEYIIDTVTDVLVFACPIGAAYKMRESLHLMMCQHFNIFDHPICYPAALLFSPEN